LENYNRQILRLPHYDYFQAGAYFVTICVQGRECLLGKVQDGEAYLSPLGEIAASSWAWLEVGYPQVSLDAWIVMPNHIHGIIVQASL
jgi:REP element-mobilizing transposase RayT